MCFPVYFPRDIFSRTTNTLISLLAKLILARSPLGLRAKIVINYVNKYSERIEIINIFCIFEQDVFHD